MGRFRSACYSGDGVGAGGASLAFEAKIAEVKCVDPFDEGSKVLSFVGDETCFEVSAQRAFGPHSCAGEIGGADEGFEPVDDNGLGVDAGAEDAFEEFALD